MFKKIFSNIIPPGVTGSGNDIMVNCPYHKDSNSSFSISTDPNKPVYHCFGCGKKGSWIGYYMESNNVSYPQALKDLDMDNMPVTPYKKQEKIVKPVIDYTEEVFKAWDNVCNDYQTHCKNLWELTGITLPTAMSCIIGFNEKGWIFPVFRYLDNKCVGYEVRKKDFTKFINPKSGKETKCYKAKDTPSCLCYVLNSDKKKCIIMEGFKDGYKMYQYLQEKNNGNRVEETIITPSCGVSHLYELLKKNKIIEEYEEVILVLDNDEAGNKARDLIQSLDSRYKFFNGLDKGEDWENYYDKKLANIK